ncbi:hypothetical protein [Phenylobacterium sp.]|uniref:hypothetical protein n=1 Tax=Phenylobacterium sp. TaxID=1871053 RepID=UPI00356161CF
MKRGLAAAGFVLAALPCAWACFVCGWQLVSFTGFAVRLDEDLPGEAWRQIGFAAAQMIVIAAALLIAWQGWQAENYRKSVLALAVAWIAAAPVFWSLVESLRPVG